MRMLHRAAVTIAAMFLTSTSLLADGETKAELRDAQEGEGQYGRLVLRGGYIIDGTGGPAYGPADVVIENNRITEIKVVGTPDSPIKPEGRPAKGDRELDVTGKYILPGFIDVHTHIHGKDFGQGVSPEYIFKLWLAHGVTTARVVGYSGFERTLDFKRRSAENKITAPRLLAYPEFDGVGSVKEAREIIQRYKKMGADGVKFLGNPKKILLAGLDEAEKLGLRTTMHHAQTAVTDANVLDTSARGLDSMEHWYGLPEAMFEDRLIQDYPSDYIYTDEMDRFGEAGKLWKQAAKPGSDKWNEVMDTLLERDFAINPTFTIYVASRDLMRMSRAVWHDEYTMPALWDFYRPSEVAHGSYWFDWTTEHEIEWKKNYKLWMQFINDYKNRGGKVGVGSDTGYIYSLYGFGYIQEFELLQEAGFHPLEVIRSATYIGAQELGMEDEIGAVEVGKMADLVVVDENPLHNFKVLYGTGAVKLNRETGLVERVGGVRWTIKDGIIYDAFKLRADVREMVREAKIEAGMNPDKPLAIANSPASE
ncbi:amidohydrolase family protein [Kordiimonas aestuarii]|uniref:amidohydrolase family protein n=1 Tax=Kordiimonas aestuarii TaxID=1005925 RepID=UPI0021D2583D|nr:amidohydrolase family protein [Kordiimonas aestuarii]